MAKIDCNDPTANYHHIVISAIVILLSYRTTFITTGLDRTYHAHRFIFCFTF